MATNPWPRAVCIRRGIYLRSGRLPRLGIGPGFGPRPIIRQNGRFFSCPESGRQDDTGAVPGRQLERPSDHDFDPIAVAMILNALRQTAYARDAAMSSRCNAYAPKVETGSGILYFHHPLDAVNSLA